MPVQSHIPEHLVPDNIPYRSQGRPAISEHAQGVTRFEYDDGREVYLVGTAHVSHKSAELVEQTLLELKPDIVCLELCKPRFESLQHPTRWRETNIAEVIRTGKAYVLMAQLTLASFQKRIAKQLNINPGEEMLRAIRVSEALAIPIEVIDREVKTTFRRAWANASLWSLLKIFFSFIGSLFTSEEIGEEEIEALKETDALMAVVNEFAHFLPGVKIALIDERDLYMCEKLSRIQARRIVAVVGAGHVPGMKAHMGENISLEELETIPPTRKSLVAISWGIPLLILCFFAYGFFHMDSSTGMQMVTAWVLAHGIPSAIGAALALAHPLTIITAFVAAPITALNPTVAAGWVCGLVEAIIRKPQVKDLESLSEDITSMKSLWNNQVTRILLIVAFSNLGSSLGTIVGGAWIVSLLQ